MQILAHRGLWRDQAERNSLTALSRAVELGFGFESDVRDYKGNLVVSHNIADQDAPEAEHVFAMLQQSKDHFPFAINIKADGLKDLLAAFLRRYDIRNYFLFDMSVPQMVEFADMGLRFFTRQSDIELQPVMYDRAAGVWMDGFWNMDWITSDLIARHLAHGKDVCIVSPDLHQREDYVTFWKRLKQDSITSDHVLLCTDHPEQARQFFAEG